MREGGGWREGTRMGWVKDKAKICEASRSARLFFTWSRSVSGFVFGFVVLMKALNFPHLRQRTWVAFFTAIFFPQTAIATYPLCTVIHPVLPPPCWRHAPLVVPVTVVVVWLWRTARSGTSCRIPWKEKGQAMLYGLREIHKEEYEEVIYRGVSRSNCIDCVFI